MARTRTLRARRPCREIRIRDWAEFLGCIGGPPYAEWAFRGQSRSAWPLSTTLSRHFRASGIDRRAWVRQEERILRIFKRKAHNYLDHVPPTEDHLQWLALMEHHGAPTRLLDFTWSPYVAAFFALERPTGEGAVWALDPERVSRRALAAMGARRDPGRVDPRQPDNLVRHFLHGTRRFVWIGEPEVMNRRLVAQSGTFAIPSVLDEDLDQLVAEGGDDDDEALVKFVMPHAGLREQGLRELYGMNITLATLFPDLDGLARSLAYELEFHWAFDPRTMRRR